MTCRLFQFSVLWHRSPSKRVKKQPGLKRCFSLNPSSGQESSFVIKKWQRAENAHFCLVVAKSKTRLTMIRTETNNRFLVQKMSENYSYLNLKASSVTYYFWTNKTQKNYWWSHNAKKNTSYLLVKWLKGPVCNMCMGMYWQKCNVIFIYVFIWA